MASKLFRAVVGVGISLAATTGACLGGLEDDLPQVDGADAASEAAAHDAAPPGEPVVDDAGHDADGGDVADARVPGTFPDTSWCDTTWPTTKGSPPPPMHCINPHGECEDAGMPQCFPSPEPERCVGFVYHYPSCVDGTWRCPPGKLARDECECWNSEPCEAGQ